MPFHLIMSLEHIDAIWSKPQYGIGHHLRQIAGIIEAQPPHPLPLEGFLLDDGNDGNLLAKWGTTDATMVHTVTLTPEERETLRNRGPNSATIIEERPAPESEVAQAEQALGRAVDAFLTAGRSFTVRNARGDPGLDLLNAWQLLREARHKATPASLTREIVEELVTAGAELTAAEIYRAAHAHHLNIKEWEVASARVSAALVRWKAAEAAALKATAP